MDIHVVYLRDNEGDFIFDWCIKGDETINSSRDMITDFISSEMVSAYCDSANLFNLDGIVAKTISVPSDLELSILDDDAELIYDLISDDYDADTLAYLATQQALYSSLEQSLDDANTIMRNEMFTRYGDYVKWDDERIAWVIGSLPTSAFKDELEEYYDSIYAVD